MPDKKLQKVVALLEVENAIIRRGDFANLSHIASQKERLLRDLEGLRATSDELATLRSAALRNAQLLTAALAGVKEARARLSALDEVRNGLNIYDKLGGRQTVARPGGALEHKA